MNRHIDNPPPTHTHTLQALPLCICGLRTVHKQTPREVVGFIMDLFKYSDNHNNKVSQK